METWLSERLLPPPLKQNNRKSLHKDRNLHKNGPSEKIPRRELRKYHLVLLELMYARQRSKLVGDIE